MSCVYDGIETLVCLIGFRRQKMKSFSWGFLDVVFDIRECLIEQRFHVMLQCPAFVFPSSSIFSVILWHILLLHAFFVHEDE
jgi:hypothetical protein